jgi:hypothetical protein
MRELSETGPSDKRNVLIKSHRPKISILNHRKTAQISRKNRWAVTAGGAAFRNNALAVCWW